MSAKMLFLINFERMELTDKDADERNCVKITSEEDLLSEFNGPQMVELYNNLSGTKIKKFADTKTAAKRTWNALVQTVTIAPAKTSKKLPNNGMDKLITSLKNKKFRQSSNHYKLYEWLSEEPRKLSKWIEFCRDCNIEKGYAKSILSYYIRNGWVEAKWI